MSAATDAGVSLRIRDSVATVVFDQERKHNALSLRTWLALPVLIADAEHNAEAGLIVLRGARGNFGAGNDLVEFGALGGHPAAALTFARAMAEAMRAVELASKPVIVAIEGCCYGASVALALAGDLRIAGDSATFATTPAKLGALYLRSDLHRLVAAVGPGQSKKLIYSGETIDAARAHGIGMVDEIVSARDFDAQLARLTASILQGSPFTLRRSKEMLANVDPTPVETEESLGWFVEATQGRDFSEGVNAFFTKRSPRFR